MDPLRGCHSPRVRGGGAASLVIGYLGKWENGPFDNPSGSGSSRMGWVVEWLSRWVGEETSTHTRNRYHNHNQFSTIRLRVRLGLRV